MANSVGFFAPPPETSTSSIGSGTNRRYASAMLAAVGDYLGMFLPGGAAVGQALNATVSLVVVTALFAMIYKLLPDTPVAWRDVWVGALLTSFLFTLGKLAIGFYLGKASVASSYGAAGSVVILLLWVYYSSMLLYSEPSSPTCTRCGTGAGEARRTPPCPTGVRAGTSSDSSRPGAWPPNPDLPPLAA
jgi:hypothetical protein